LEFLIFKKLILKSRKANNAEMVGKKSSSQIQSTSYRIRSLFLFVVVVLGVACRLRLLARETNSMELSPS
jgi:hypothetical protein